MIVFLIIIHAYKGILFAPVQSTASLPLSPSSSANALASLNVSVSALPRGLNDTPNPQAPPKIPQCCDCTVREILYLTCSVPFASFPSWRRRVNI